MNQCFIAKLFRFYDYFLNMIYIYICVIETNKVCVLLIKYGIRKVQRIINYTFIAESYASVSENKNAAACEIDLKSIVSPTSVFPKIFSKILPFESLKIINR